MGFTVGAMYSGGAFTKLLKGAKILKDTSTLGAQMTGAMFSAVNEGRIEANQSARDMIEKTTMILDQSRVDAIREISADPTLSPQERAVRVNEIDRNYISELARADEQARKLGNVDLLLNIPILTADNFYTFGKFYSKGFDNAKASLKGNVKKKTVSEAANEALRQDSNIIAKGVKKVKDGGKYTWETITDKKAVGKGLLTGLREGNEELAQQMAANFAANIESDSPDSYYKVVTDPKAERQAMSTMTALGKAFADSYGNGDQWEQFAVGALTGLLGTPTFGRVQNADANTYMGRGSRVGLTGGIFGEIASARETNKRGRETVDRMNAFKERYGFDGTADDWIKALTDKSEKARKNLMARKAFNDAMDGWAEKDDKFEFKNSEDNEMWSMINAYLAAGRKADLMAMVGADFEHMSQEALENTAKLTSPQDVGVRQPGSPANTAGWRDANGNYVTDTEEGTEEMRKQLIAKRDSIKKDIDLYEKSLSRVRAISNNDVNRSEDEVSELAWLLWKTEKFKDRVQSIKQERAQDFYSLDSVLQTYQETLEEILGKKTVNLEPNSLDAWFADVVNAQLLGNQRDAAQDLEYISAIRSFLNLISESDEAQMPALSMTIQAYSDLIDDVAGNKVLYSMLAGRMDEQRCLSMMGDLKDIGRLSKAYSDFQKRFNDFAKNPLKQKQNRQKIDGQRKKVEKAVADEAARTRTGNLTKEQYLGLNKEERSAVTDSLPEDAAAEV